MNDGSAVVSDREPQALQQPPAGDLDTLLLPRPQPGEAADLPGWASLRYGQTWTVSPLTALAVTNPAHSRRGNITGKTRELGLTGLRGWLAAKASAPPTV